MSTGEYKEMKVSVIIPVYNAAKFVTQAVESALMQPETGEVILIEDGSIDNSLQVCSYLSKRYNKVHLFRHNDGDNRGAGASRNLGLQKSVHEFIAFLDADDYFLPSRFATAKRIFASDPYCEGVYEAAGFYYEDEQALVRWRESGKDTEDITTVFDLFPPEELFERLINGKSGYFLITGLMIKKSVIKKTGYMNENLRIHQDTEFIYRLAAVSRLLPGSIKIPVVIYRIHKQNRSSQPRSNYKLFKDEMLMWIYLYRWFHRISLKKERSLIVNSMIRLVVKKYMKPLFPILQRIKHQFAEKTDSRIIN